ncbi:hypothetical protein BD779DRAFT_1475148 [Infundibulicybe gibba]|nr:hypothetical protein BD779DRAFT_1475148 [Infundibulicybe gibba]
MSSAGALTLEQQAFATLKQDFSMEKLRFPLNVIIPRMLKIRKTKEFVDYYANGIFRSQPGDSREYIREIQVKITPNSRGAETKPLLKPDDPRLSLEEVGPDEAILKKCGKYILKFVDSKVELLDFWIYNAFEDSILNTLKLHHERLRKIKNIKRGSQFDSYKLQGGRKADAYALYEGITTTDEESVHALLDHAEDDAILSHTAKAVHKKLFDELQEQSDTDDLLGITAASQYYLTLPHLFWRNPYGMHGIRVESGGIWWNPAKFWWIPYGFRQIPPDSVRIPCGVWWIPYGLRMDSMWSLVDSVRTPYELQTDSVWTPCGLGGIHTESTQSPHGFHTDSTWIPHGFHMDSTQIPHGFHLDYFIWNPYGIRAEFSRVRRIPYGFHMESTWNSEGFSRILCQKYNMDYMESARNPYGVRRIPYGFQRNRWGSVKTSHCNEDAVCSLCAQYKLKASPREYSFIFAEYGKFKNQQAAQRYRTIRDTSVVRSEYWKEKDSMTLHIVREHHNYQSYSGINNGKALKALFGMHSTGGMPALGADPDPPISNPIKSLHCLPSARPPGVRFSRHQRIFVFRDALESVYNTLKNALICEQFRGGVARIE